VGRRNQRVGESMREVLGELLQRQVKDPRVGFVTITAVRVKPDLSRADVYYTVLGDERDRAATQAGLESAAPFLRSETGRRVRKSTRSLPTSIRKKRRIRVCTCRRSIPTSKRRSDEPSM
jgi:ribosome-binding factor A